MTQTQILQNRSQTVQLNRGCGESNIRRQRAIYHAFVLFLCAVVLIGARIFDAGGDGLYLFGFKWPVGCRLYETFGIKCALCGLSRSLCCLAHGSFQASLKFHVLGPAVFAFICLQILYRIYAMALYPAKVSTKLSKANFGAAVALSITVFANWLSYLGGLIL